ncbi:MAG: ATP synthase F1 subunit delta [Oscillospiraceae bacterium]|jgi:F-type H+-transporting ATPase subunit delta|nr:ATP synthase F1 subunit delta [Oscillospiraceae bacterium]
MERLSTLYASALYELAVEKGVENLFLSQAIMLRDSLQDPDCQRMLVSPQVSASDKNDMFKRAFSGHIHEDLLGFLYLVTNKNREAYLISSLTALINTIERHNNKVTAKVLSAAPYDDKQANLLKEVLSKKLNKDVTLSMKVDKSLIGGPYIYADGYYIDWTVKKKLHDLNVSLVEQRNS